MTKVKQVLPVVQKTKKEKKDIRKEIQELLNTIGQSWCEVAKKLSQVYYAELFKTWGFESFEGYCKAELDMEYRVAMFYVQIGNTIEKYGISENVIKSLGWSKFKELTYLFKEGITKEDISSLVSEVKNMSFTEVKDFVKKERITRAGGDATILKRKVKLEFNLMNEQAAVIEEALKEAASLTNTDNQGVLLEFICMSFLMTKTPATDEILSKLHNVEDVEIPLERKQKADKGKSKRNMLVI